MRIPDIILRCWPGLLLVAALLGGCGDDSVKDERAASPYPHPAAPESRRETAQGPVVGFADANDTYGWMGIPFAAPPVGELRWRAPRPPIDRRELLEATAPREPCMHINPFAGDDGEPVGGAEDCLYLHVWAPRVVPAEGLPVMVWIHGGANTVGTANMFTTFQDLVSSHQVVVVALNYRLGVLGWFNHPALVAPPLRAARLAEPNANAIDASGNYGTLDLIAGLRWVRNNIAAFGGNPGRVTIFGESAGGANVLSLMTSPLARDLFHGAIAQSGLAANVPVGLARDGLISWKEGAAPSGSFPLVDALLVQAGLAADRRAARELQQALPAAELRSFLRELDGAALFKPLYGDDGADMSDATYKWPAPIADGTVMPADWQLAVMADPQQVADVPLLLGSNRDEMRLFQFMDPSQVRFLFGMLPRPRDEAAYLQRSHYGSELWRAVGVIDPAQRLAESRGERLYTYRFDWDEWPHSLLVDMRTLLGAAHAIDLGFVVGESNDMIGRFRGHSGENREGQQWLGQAMRSYWAEFAHTGAPGRGRDGTLPLWPSWQAGDGESMILDTQEGGGIRLEAASVTVAEVRQQLRDDPALAPAARCDLHRHLFGEHFAVALRWQPLPGCDDPVTTAASTIEASRTIEASNGEVSMTDASVAEAAAGRASASSAVTGPAD